MSSNGTPNLAFCPRCFCPLDIGRPYLVNVCPPVAPPYSPTVHPAPANQLPTGGSDVGSSPSSVPQRTDASLPLSQPSTHCNSAEHEQTQGENRRSSAASSSSLDSAFSDFSINTEFEAALKATEEYHFSQQPFQASSPQPPPTSSPSTESSLTPLAVPTSSPSTESSLTLSAPDEPPSAMRRWVVFRGRVPGVYASS